MRGRIPIAPGSGPRSASPLVALCVLTSSARANVPPAVATTNTIHIPVMNDAADGMLTTRVTYTDTTASATASTGNTIGLGKGSIYQLTTCIAAHVGGRTPVSSCADRTIDARANTATVVTYAPSVSLDQPRPSSAIRFTYFTSVVQVSYRTGASWTLVAHSWPASGLQGAAIPVAVQGTTLGSLPANSPLTLSIAYKGAVDSGQPDSICRGAAVASYGGGVPAGVSTTNSAFAGAPAYYEVGQPTGTYAGQPRRGTMLVIHGGGWVAYGQGAVESSRTEADRWRARGFQTVSITYNPCGRSVADAAWFYDHTRAALGATEKICATGISAGGHLALMLATYRSDVYCVVSQAGPTDLTTAQLQGAYDPAGFSGDDQLVPYGQATVLLTAMLAANPSAYSVAVQLPKGPVAFGHGGVTQAALDDFRAREVALVAPI